MNAGDLERSLVDGWLRRGQHERVMRYVQLRSAAFPKLYLYRAAIGAAAARGDYERLERFAEAARERFPESSVGYVGLVKGLLKKNRVHEAQCILQAAPKEGHANGETARAELEIERALGKLAVQHEGFADPSSRTAKVPTQLDGMRRKYAHAATQKLWTEAKRWAEEAVARYPDVCFGHMALAEALVGVGNPEAGRRILEGLPPTSPVKAHLLLAELYRSARQDQRAAEVLTLAQRFHPADRRLLMRLGDLYRDDGQSERAHVYFRLAERVHPEYGAVRLLTFESDEGWLEAGAETLKTVLAFKPRALVRFMAIVNRVGVLYPALSDELKAARAAVRKDLWQGALNSQQAFDTALRTALNNRWLSDCADLLSMGEQRGLKPGAAALERLTKIRTALGPLVDLVELAWRNEHERKLFVVSKSGIDRVTADKLRKDNVVELFLPTPFFAFDDTEKPPYESVRATFRAIAEELLGRDDVRVVPRMQLNWRHAVPRTTARSISYHTRAAHDPRRLHVQESSLSGHCSFDACGFAGFASIADDFERIDSFTRSVDASALEANYRALHEHFVKRNVSKYSQPEGAEGIAGRYVFVPLQVTTDVVTALAWVPWQGLLRTLADCLAGTDVRVVVKRHPYCRSMTVQRVLAELAASDGITVSSGSVHALAAGAEVVYTVNSGAGLESLLNMRPVVVTGACDYLYAATAARSIDELTHVIRTGPQLDRAKVLRFLYFYHQAYVVDSSDGERVRGLIRQWLEGDVAQPVGVRPSRARTGI